ncbi:interleukin-6-like [Sebastes fasciatus]|uniref:interleukin-6-like n=1 Tax=Sebastes fasciatus TaxID=394691 RepID=UPI003D9F7FC3
MPSHLNSSWLSAVMLAALLLCAPGAPVEDLPTDSPASGEPSGEEEVWPSDLLSSSRYWDIVIDATKRHQQEFENEFQNEVEYIFLEHYRISSLPAGCPLSNFSKEACLHRLAQGLLVYTVLLKHVEKEYPSSSIRSQARYYSSILINLIKEKMRNPEQVTAPTSSQETQLLMDLDNSDTFQRRMTAHSIMRKLHFFLIDSKRAISKREKTRGSMANRSTPTISFYIQKLKDGSINQL